MENDITELRKHLFETLAALRANKNPMEIDRARAVAELAQVVINSAKVEVEHLRVVGGHGTGFLPAPTPGGNGAALPEAAGTTVTPLAAGGRLLQHRMK